MHIREMTDPDFKRCGLTLRFFGNDLRSSATAPLTANYHHPINELLEWCVYVDSNMVLFVLGEKANARFESESTKMFACDLASPNQKVARLFLQALPDTLDESFINALCSST